MMTFANGGDPLGVDEQLHDVRASVDALSGHVTALTGELSVLAQMQQSQQFLARQNIEIKQNLVKVDKAAQRRTERAQLVARRMVWIVGLILAATAILTVNALLQHVDDLLAEQRSNQAALLRKDAVTRYESCRQRNRALQIQIDREVKLAALEGDPAVSKVHSDSANGLAKSSVRCIPPSN